MAFLIQERQLPVTKKRPMSEEKHKTRAKSAGIHDVDIYI